MVEKTKVEVFAAMQDLGFLRFETVNFSMTFSKLLNSYNYI